jgi:hypothetical protein
MDPRAVQHGKKYRLSRSVRIRIHEAKATVVDGWGTEKDV